MYYSSKSWKMQFTCAHKNVCAYIHTWQIYKDTHIFICILYTSSIGWIINIIIVLPSELFECLSTEINKSKEQHLSSLEGHGQPSQAQNALSEFTQQISWKTRRQSAWIPVQHYIHPWPVIHFPISRLCTTCKTLKLLPWGSQVISTRGHVPFRKHTSSQGIGP